MPYGSENQSPFSLTRCKNTGVYLVNLRWSGAFPPVWGITFGTPHDS
jgi:hypothetical protein